MTKLRSKTAKLTEDRESFSMIDHKAYVFYKNKSNLNSRELVAHYVEYGKLISAFYKIVIKNIAETKGGVFINNFGYFGVLKYNKKSSMYFDQENKRYSINTDDNFWISFIPISKNNKRRVFLFDLSFSKNLKKLVSANLTKGYRYVFNASLFFSKLKKSYKI